MAVTYVIHFELRPGQKERFMNLLGGVLEAMRGERTFIEAILHQDPENDHRFMLYETWADHQEVLDVQVKRPYRQAWHAALPDLLAAPRDISMWTPVRVDRAARKETV